ncbi:MAG TPA: pirin-like C-terminal cupin domain-containing protein, partial [Opitutaceae bacterium]|nr:pirin-like C-terminal cupin domain-containing protein [Opitutaceae bacterium]
PPRYQTLSADRIPVVALPQDAGKVRVIAGDYSGHIGPARTFTPINLWDVTLHAGKSSELPLPEGHTTAVFVLKGNVIVDGDRAAGEGDLAVFSQQGTGLTLRATIDATLLMMCGEPIDEPVVGKGPFVMNTHAEILQAFRDYQLGNMGTLSAS